MSGSWSLGEVALIRDAATLAIYNSFNSKVPQPSEPQLVANLVWQLPLCINKLPSRIGIKAGGVFVHQRPYVTFLTPSPATVEIGDLLLIRTLVINGKIEEQRALLLQAKKTKHMPATPDNANQWFLYEQWPSFTYSPKYKGLAGKTRHIREPDMYDAAKYLLIGSNPALSQWVKTACGCFFHCDCYGPAVLSHHTAQPTKPNISRYKRFADELVQFLMGNAGKVYEPPTTNTTGWNQVIDDLITDTATASTVFMGRASSQLVKSSRGCLSFMTPGNSSIFFTIVKDVVVNENPSAPPEVPAEWSLDGEGGGISIVEVVVEQGDD